MNEKSKNEFNVVLQRQTTTVPTDARSTKALAQAADISEVKHDWVKHLLAQLNDPRHSQTVYAAKIKRKLEQALNSWSYRLDPQHYRRLYINKVY